MMEELACQVSELPALVELIAAVVRRELIAVEALRRLLADRHGLSLCKRMRTTPETCRCEL